jgi:hypothetical protein
VAAPASKIAAAIEYATLRSAGKTLEPLPFAAEGGSCFDQWHELVHVLPNIGSLSLTIDETNAVSMTVDAD